MSMHLTLTEMRAHWEGSMTRGAIQPSSKISPTRMSWFGPHHPSRPLAKAFICFIDIFQVQFILKLCYHLHIYITSTMPFLQLTMWVWSIIISSSTCLILSSISLGQALEESTRLARLAGDRMVVDRCTWSFFSLSLSWSFSHLHL